MSSTDLVDYLREQIDLHLRSGYGTDDTVMAQIKDRLSDELRDADYSEGACKVAAFSSDRLGSSL